MRGWPLSVSNEVLRRLIRFGSSPRTAVASMVLAIPLPPSPASSLCAAGRAALLWRSGWGDPYFRSASAGICDEWQARGERAAPSIWLELACGGCRAANLSLPAADPLRRTISKTAWSGSRRLLQRAQFRPSNGTAGATRAFSR